MTSTECTAGPGIENMPPPPPSRIVRTPALSRLPTLQREASGRDVLTAVAGTAVKTNAALPGPQHNPFKSSSNPPLSCFHLDGRQDLESGRYVHPLMCPVVVDHRRTPGARPVIAQPLNKRLATEEGESNNKTRTARRGEENTQAHPASEWQNSRCVNARCARCCSTANLSERRGQADAPATAAPWR